ncbi:hypothetical protein Cfla_0617 [Cellulomonas flavigena DSM 20109]|uniref:Replication-associated protein ORF2/G2P domain-containing protein n=1 Tax=Cellulomonas flavigena (strain ATCC 482 / DSM 20109 / BCRC 11376 / JCM 18109 / NBRC 3775 / NCIMB 8073 / NRS 134) TaxID=446466 RepID=D5UIN0_CELFN|nr:hypothetical protein Cfla_0617 [Cellulomonas flavigena DSM 20109]
MRGVVSLFPPTGWSFSLYPDAAEGGGTVLASSRRAPARVAPGEATDPSRAAREAGRRARGKLRRYCAANRLNRLGTLTYRGEGCHDSRQVRADVGEFFRALRAGLDGERLAYVWVPEWHKSGHGLHVHFAVGRYVPRSLIEEAWGRGFVHIKLLGGMPVGSGPREEARRAAGYLSKYVAKTFSDPSARVLGLHRYDVAQGFQPEKVTIRGRSLDDVLDQACEAMDADPERFWWSGDVADWDRPPAVWAQWR